MTKSTSKHDRHATKKKDKRKHYNFLRAERRRNIRQKKIDAWNNPIVSIFGVRVQSHQGLFLAKGTATGESPLLENFNKKLIDSIRKNNSYHKNLNICKVTNRRVSFVDLSYVMVPLKKGGKWEMIPQKLYLHKLKRNERNDLASLQEWATLVEKAISEHEKNSSPPLKIKFDSDITSGIAEHFFYEDGNEYLPSVDSILQAYDVVEFVMKRYKMLFLLLLLLLKIIPSFCPHKHGRNTLHMMIWIM